MSYDDEITKRATTAARTAGYRPLHDEELPKTATPTVEETVQERAARQRLERRAELTYSSEDYERWDENRESALADRQAGTFMLGWMQSPTTQSQDDLWASLYTSETTEEQKQFIRSCNVHLNEPVRQGEIVVLPTTKPKTPEDKKLLGDLIEQARIASLELGKLLDDELATLHRHFELFSHQLAERIATDGLPTDYYAQVATGVGATATGVEQNLKNIQNVLLEINDLYASQVAMASRTGGVNYGTFTAERAALFKKLDGSFARLSSRSVQLPIYKQVKRNLKLSTKSVIHNADEILKKGFVKDLGKRIANISIGISASRGLGYIGLTVGAVSGVNNIYEACKVDSTGNCGKTTTREVTGFIGGWGGGIAGGSAGASLSVATISGLALIVGVTVSAPVLAVAAIGGAVAGGFVGGVAGGTTGKAVGDGLYFLYESAGEMVEDLKDTF
ncbi:hypothetical protein [Vibrio coralliilyticus]|uniref:hypothetical protein n=1 Tax=Vibrio coralliilyticus TaxID=190893 RepID=UPI0002EB878C|nr:hypothetical protein [Vibrio coralliilyticus]